MAILGFVSKPGTSSGPCGGCRHDGCESMRSEAKARCLVCHREIGYDRSFLRDPNGPRHADCEAPKAGG